MDSVQISMVSIDIPCVKRLVRSIYQNLYNILVAQIPFVFFLRVFPNPIFSEPYFDSRVFSNFS